MTDTPRAVHTTLRHLSAVVSRGETQMRQWQDGVTNRYYYNPKKTDQEVEELERLIAAKEQEIAPVRKALATLAVVIGEGLI